MLLCVEGKERREREGEERGRGRGARERERSQGEGEDEIFNCDTVRSADEDHKLYKTPPTLPPHQPLSLTM